MFDFSVSSSSFKDLQFSSYKYSRSRFGSARERKDAGFLPHTCTGVRRLRTGSDTARLHRTPAPGPLLGTGSLVSEVHCPDTSPDLSCQKNKPTIGLFLAQRNLSALG